MSLKQIPMGLDRTAVLASALLALLLACLTAQTDVLPGTSWYSIGNYLFALHDLSIFCPAVPVMFSRMVVHPGECFRQRALVSLIVGAVAIFNKHLLLQGRSSSYSLLIGSQVASYVVALKWRTALQSTLFTGLSLAVTFYIMEARCWVASMRAICILAVLCTIHSIKFQPALGRLSLSQKVVGGTVGLAIGFMLPRLFNLCLPVDEIMVVYATVSRIADAAFGNLAIEMLLVTANVQISLGYQSLQFLRSVQDRQNALLTVGAGTSLSAKGYAARAQHWVFFVCLPYLLSKTVMTSVQTHHFGRFRHWAERRLRLHSFFPDEGHAGTMLKAAALSNFTVEQYADAINGALEMSFGIISARLFSLPKLMLLPGVVLAKPWLMLSVVPASMLLDTCKAGITAYLTAEVEMLHRHLLELASKRRRLELHDMKNEDLMQRARASRFAQRQWRSIGDQIEDHGMRLKSLQLLHSTADQMYRQLLLGPGIECTLAFLMETGYICSTDIYLYTSVLEHTIDTVLTRQREQATLASIQTKISVLRQLIDQQAALHAAKRPQCRTTKSSQVVHITSLEYTRGQAHVQIPSLVLPMGRIVAVTGANGCGKSTALAYVASCRDGTWGPAGAELAADTIMDLPSSDIVEIAQQFYWPMFASPMSWLLFQDGRDGGSELALRARAQQMLREFGLIRPIGLEATSELSLDDVKEDWYGELSGGERCKVEFIQKVFLRDECPPILLIDEAFAPLDPASSRHLKQKLKLFCFKSLVLVVEHGTGRLDGSFFDDELQFANGTATLRSLH